VRINRSNVAGLRRAPILERSVVARGRLVIFAGFVRRSTEDSCRVVEQSAFAFGDRLRAEISVAPARSPVAEGRLQELLNVALCHQSHALGLWARGVFDSARTRRWFGRRNRLDATPESQRNLFWCLSQHVAVQKIPAISLPPRNRTSLDTDVHVPVFSRNIKSPISPVLTGEGTPSKLAHGRSRNRGQGSAQRDVQRNDAPPDRRSQWALMAHENREWRSTVSLAAILMALKLFRRQTSYHGHLRLQP